MKRLVFWLSEFALLAASLIVMISHDNWSSWLLAICLVSIAVLRSEIVLLKSRSRPTNAPDQKATESVQRAVARFTMDMSEVLSPLVDSAEGHRRRLVEVGWGEEAAERMASAYYLTLLATFEHQQSHHCAAKS